MNRYVDIWDIPNTSWTLKEDYLNENLDKKIVDGVNILAIVEGVFFVPDGISRNERYYPKTFWETILANPELKCRIAEKRLLGTIGHADKSVDEDDIAGGKVSHIVTKLWIDENNRGMGQCIILGTPAGRNLYCLMKAGSKIKTSSRASGDYKTNETYNNMPIVDENNYFLETFDFVLNPGFLETDPKLMENMKKIQSKMEAHEMEYGKELLEHIKKESKELSETAIKLREEKAVLQAEITKLNEQLVASKQLEKTNSILSEELQATKSELARISEEAKENAVIVEEFKVLAEGAEISEFKQVMSEAQKLLESYSKLGNPSKIRESLREHKELKNIFEGMGVEEVRDTVQMVEQTLVEIEKLGSISEIKEIMQRAEQLIVNNHKEKMEDLVLKISREYRTPIESVRSLLENVGESKTIDILKGLNNISKTTAKEENLKKEIQKDKTRTLPTPAPVSEQKKETTTFAKQMFERMQNIRK